MVAASTQPAAAPLRLAMPSAFIAGLCVMIVELVAGHVISGFLGQSIHTWTTVIGAILAGISLGNYFGGRLADRFAPSRLLGSLFVLSAIACLLIPALNKVVGNALDGSDVGPARIVQHIFLVFLLPGILLGTSGPVIARGALDAGRPEGRTVGTVYAINALGSILGAFLTGFWLVPTFPISMIIRGVAVALAALGIVHLLLGRAPSPSEGRGQGEG